MVFAVAFLVLLPFYLGPLFVTPLLPGLDLPFHLSLIDMLAKDGRPGSPYAPFYEGTLGLGPYSAYYIAVLVLGRPFGLLLAHKIVVAAYVAGMPLSVAAVLGACGRSRVPALLAFPLAYNLTLHYGFISFALSVPVLFWLLAEIARFQLQPRASARDWLLTTMAAIALYLCHLQNFLYGLCAALAFVLFSGAPWRRRLGALGALAPSLLGLMWWKRHATYAGGLNDIRNSPMYAYQSLKWSRLADLGGGTRPIRSDVAQRILTLPGHVLRGFADMVDMRATQTLFTLIAAYAMLGLWGLQEPRPPGPRPRLGLAAWLVCLGALLAYLALPHHLPNYEITTFFPRFAAVLAASLLLLVPSGLRRFPDALRFLLPVPAVAFGVLYGRELTRHYRMYGAEVADFVALVDTIPPGKKVFGLLFDRSSRVMRVDSAFLGLPNFYPALRPGPGSMVPLLYCGMRHIPCRRTGDFEGQEYSPWGPHVQVPSRTIPFIDYFITRSAPPADALFREGAPAVELVERRHEWALYRSRPDALRWFLRQPDEEHAD